MTTAIISGFEPFRRRVQERLFARLPEHGQRLRWSAGRIAAYQQERLRSLLDHAIAQSRFHARRLSGFDPSRFELADLARLPVMTKAEMMEAFDEVLTDPRLSRQQVEETLARTGEVPIPLFDEYICQATGGSSGQRGVFVLDTEAMADFACSLLRTPMPRAERGDRDHLTIALGGAASAVHATGIAPKLLEGSPFRFVSVPATLPVAEVVERLNALQPDALFGYASMLARLVSERRAGRLRIKPAVLRSTSETLLPEHRAAIAEAFGVQPVDTFASSEGLTGHSGPGESAVTFASDLCIVELVDDQNHPVPVGEPSAKILVTNLYNRVQPLIRYALEDTFVRQPDDARHGHFRATVQGRADDILHYAGTDIHPLVVRSVMVKTPEIADYQVHQTPSGIDVAVVTNAPLDRARLGERLCGALCAAGLEQPTVEVRTVHALERRPGTGKLRRFVPL
jgi:phenylacetate-CoA ligase